MSTAKRSIAMNATTTPNGVKVVHPKKRTPTLPLANFDSSPLAAFSEPRYVCTFLFFCCNSCITKSTDIFCLLFFRSITNLRDEMMMEINKVREEFLQENLLLKEEVANLRREIADLKKAKVTNSTNKKIPPGISVIFYTSNSSICR